MTAVFALSLELWATGNYSLAYGIHDVPQWQMEFVMPWIPSLGISIHLGVDGLSLALVVLTGFLGILSVLCSWREIQRRTGFFHLNLMWIIGGVVGVFLALDLFLFFFFWEVMLVPMYFLIALWGHSASTGKSRITAATKFFIYTQASGLLMLLSKDFLKLVAIALLIASPVAWYFMQRWLEDFAYRIRMDGWVFFTAGLVAVMVAFLTVSFQSIKAALANPVNSLRNE